MEIGKIELSKIYPQLNCVALAYGLKLNRVKDFKLARLILVNLYNKELI